MIRRRLCLAALLVSAGAAPPPVTGPREAVAMADAAKGGQKGRFEMDVADTGRVGGSVFLNSSADYRAPDDLTFRLAPNVVKAFATRYGQPPETFFKGRHVVVAGTVKRELIVNEDAYFHRSVSANRWQHTVQVILPGQLVSVSS